jgi:hypothetical protein
MYLYLEGKIIDCAGDLNKVASSFLDILLLLFNRGINVFNKDKYHFIDNEGICFYLEQVSNKVRLESDYSDHDWNKQVTERLHQLAGSKEHVKVISLEEQAKPMGPRIPFSEPEKVRRVVKNPVVLQRPLPSRMETVKKSFDNKILSMQPPSLGSEPEDPLLDAPREVKKFAGQKETFKRIWEDVTKGKITESEIPMFFNKEFPIFKVMLENGDLQLDEHHSISKERDIFTALSQELYGVDKQKTDIINVTVPPSWSYMSSQMKQKMAATFDMDVSELEDIYNKQCSEQENKMFSDSEESEASEKIPINESIPDLSSDNSVDDDSDGEFNVN